MNLNKESMVNFIKQCQRVLKVSRKPDSDEFINVAKVTGIGIILIGVIGFIIIMISQLIQGTG
ncbi:MAG: protein translocase SEC61 complex subunit gamma [Methanobacterium sp.]|jgi:protein transport protein SEC61 subunit gamma-like protein|nr:protein translocase SEC61 complex subunit gamma [Methanobacterium sp.]HHY00690.1 protein translocase SEC61 complex subunit gamma [Methanothermobacter sp.]